MVLVKNLLVRERKKKRFENTFLDRDSRVSWSQADLNFTHGQTELIGHNKMLPDGVAGP